MSTPALLVIDIQRAAFDGVRCPPMDAPDRLVERAGRLVQAARDGGRTIVFVQHSEGAGTPFDEDTEHWLLHESLVPTAGDVMLKKYASSSFEHTDLDAQLKARQIDTLVLCGLQSEHCVSNTARSALGLGYAVHVADDAHGTWPDEGRTADEIRADVNARLAQAGASVGPSERLAGLLRGG